MEMDNPLNARYSNRSSAISQAGKFELVCFVKRVRRKGNADLSSAQPVDTRATGCIALSAISGQNGVINLLLARTQDGELVQLRPMINFVDWTSPRTFRGCTRESLPDHGSARYPSTQPLVGSSPSFQEPERAITSISPLVLYFTLSAPH